MIPLMSYTQIPFILTTLDKDITTGLKPQLWNPLILSILDESICMGLNTFYSTTFL